MKIAFRRGSLKRAKKGCEGFSLMEVLIASVILVIGLLSLMSLFVTALAAVKSSDEDMIARQKAREALESIYTARNDGTITFASIQNVSKGGIFTDNFQTMYLPGANGIPGTSQDSTILDRVILPGKNGIVETDPAAAAPAGDDVLVPLSNFQRQILINNVTDPDGTVNVNMRQVTVTVRVWSTKGYSRDYTTSGYISSYQ